MFRSSLSLGGLYNGVMGDHPSKTISLPTPPNIPPNTVCCHRAVTRKCQDLESLLSLPSPSLSLSVLQMTGTQWSLRNLEDLRCSPQPRLLGSNLRAQPELGKGWVGVFEEGHLITPQNKAWAVPGQGWPRLPSCAPSCPKDDGPEHSATTSAAHEDGGFLLSHPHIPIPLQPLPCRETKHIVEWEPSRPIL